MLKLGGIDTLERQLHAGIVARNKRGDARVTIVEAIDEAALWPEAFGSLAPLTPNVSIEQLGSRAPGFICAVASEIGFRFEGVGAIFWAHFEQALGLAISQTERHIVAHAFEALADRYKLARPSKSAFTEHFSIIAWPIANALLPADLVGPVTRLLARNPVRATLRLVVALLEQRLAYSLGNSAVRLTVQDQRIDGAPDIVHRGQWTI